MAMDSLSNYGWRVGVILLMGEFTRDVHGYSWGDIAASWAAASFLALLAPRGIFSREPGR
jgi:hypothetical protein